MARSYIEARRGIVALIVGMVGVAALGFATYKTSGFGTWRFNTAAIEQLTSLYQNESAKWSSPETTNQCFQMPEPYVIPKEDFYVERKCLQRRPGKQAVMLLGDSHSASLGVGLRQWAKTRDIDFLQASGFLDPRLFCVNQKTRANWRACAPDFARAVMKTLAEAKPDVLVIDMYWSHPETLSGYANMEDWVQQIQRAVLDIAANLGVKKIIVVGEMPTWKGDLPNLLLNKFVKKHSPIPERTFVAIDKTSLQMEAALQKVTWPKNTEYFSLQDHLCSAKGCLTRVGEDLRTDIVVWDYGHLTEAASRYVVAHGLAELITQALKR